MVNVPIIFDWLKSACKEQEKKSEDQIPIRFLPKNTYLRTDFIAISCAYCINLQFFPLPAMILQDAP